MIRNLHKKIQNRNIDILISNLILESIFDFRKWSNWKYANTSICVFSVCPLPKVKNWFWNQIWNENVHIFILIFYGFGLYFKNLKNGFPIVFSKSDQGSVYFLAEDFFWKANLLVVACRKLKYEKCLIAPANPHEVSFLIWNVWCMMCDVWSLIFFVKSWIYESRGDQKYPIWVFSRFCSGLSK